MDTLRSYDTFVASLRCFDWLPAEITGGSDVDLMVERNGSVLFIEAKPREGPQVWLPWGQFKAFKALAGKPAVSVWLIAEDEKAKADAAIPRYSILPIEERTKPHDVQLHNGVQSARFFTDSSFEHVTLQGLRNRIKSWWCSQ